MRNLPVQTGMRTPQVQALLQHQTDRGRMPGLRVPQMAQRLTFISAQRETHTF